MQASLHKFTKQLADSTSNGSKMGREKEDQGQSAKRAASRPQRGFQPGISTPIGMAMDLERHRPAEGLCCRKAGS